MKAMVIEDFGGPEQLKLADLPTPTPADDEVLIEVAYTSVNPVEWKIREGMLTDLFPHHFPLILGWDAAGTVSALGSNAAGFVIGEKVYAYCRKPEIRYGTYAEFVAVDHAAVAPMPANLSFAEAATIPLTGLTSWQALFDFAGLKAGQKVLIHAGAGAIGSLAIQFAKHAGASVITTASLGNHDYVKRLGADAAVDYASEDFAAAVTELEPDGIDVVYDAVGGETQRRSYEVLKPGGVMVSIVDAPDGELAERYGVKAGFVFVEPNGAQLREITGLIEAGKVKPAAIEEMNLEDAATAQERSKAGHVRGKIVLKIK
jgi:NADPH2:quinone reductase